jgi:hypothetical protein
MSHSAFIRKFALDTKNCVVAAPVETQRRSV